jgi:DNA processing protein
VEGFSFFLKKHCNEGKVCYILMDDRWILLGLHETEGIGWKTIRAVVDRLDRLTDLLTMDSGDMVRLGIPKHKASLLAALDADKIYARLQQYEKRGIQVITALDPDYPELLKRSSQHPWVLYARGRTEWLAKPCLSMVGTRTPTTYGKRMAVDLAKQVSGYGFCVVSGMARGIDTCAHLGALETTGGTIAVLGGDLDYIYPPENRELYRQIAERGLILSEMPLGTVLNPGHFPLRNRIIAGMTMGTIVVEAAERSGSLITAEIALSESRDIFAVPGPVTSPKSRGAHKLIKDGGVLTESIEDIIKQYSYLFPEVKPAKQPIGRDLNMTTDERKVLSLLSPIPISIDLLLEQSGFDFGHLHSVLLSLLVKNKIEQLPGAVYITI